MTGQPDPDRLRNREVLAERLGWPADGLPACLALEAEFPRWIVSWTKGGLPASPRCGYRARSVEAVGHRARVELFAETPEELRAELVAADAELPPPWP